MENLKIHVRTETQSRVAQNLLFELGYVWVDSQDQLQMKFVEPCWYSAFEDGDLCRDVLDVNQNHREVDTFELSRMVIKKHNLDAVDSPNDIARTAEVHREHNLSNELNDLCAEFGCPPGMDRFAWLKDQLDISQGRVSLGPLATKARMQQESMELRLALLKDLFQPQPVTYHYAASINTARGTVAYDGVITMPQRITGMEDYLQARTEIAKDGNVAPEQVNVHSLSIIS